MHPITIPDYQGNDFYELGKKIAELRYDLACEVLSGFIDSIIEQEQSDHARGRKQLASRLSEVGAHLVLAQNALTRAWNICRPYMHEELKTQGNLPFENKDNAPTNS